MCLSCLLEFEIPPEVSKYGYVKTETHYSPELARNY